MIQARPAVPGAFLFWSVTGRAEATRSRNLRLNAARLRLPWQGALLFKIFSPRMSRFIFRSNVWFSTCNLFALATIRASSLKSELLV